MNGAGVALADFDGDGLCDIFACNKEGASGLFRNLGNGHFTNVAEIAGASVPHLIATGATAADVNGDGRPDLHVTSFLGPDALLLNLGEGRFTNVTTQAGLTSSGGTTSSAFGDIDGDGDLDLYLCRFGIEAVLRDGARIATRQVNGNPVVTGRFAKRIRIVRGQMIEVGEPDTLFLNDGTGHFSPAPWRVFSDASGNALTEGGPPDFGLAVQIRDFDGNGTPDIYVCNDFQTPDRLWLGDGRGHFRAASSLALRTMSYASMGIDAADLDRDGYLDFITVEMLARDHSRHLAQSSPMDPLPLPPGDLLSRAEVPRNALFWNRGDGTYAEVAWAAGVAMSDWSWTPIFLDVDLDGFEDLLISNGHAHDVNDLDTKASRTSPRLESPEAAQRLMLSYQPLHAAKAAWRNLGHLQFQPASEAWGFQSDQIVHGLALGDWDNDGDLDMVGNAWGKPPVLWRNESAAPRIAVQLVGLAPNRFGIGAKVRLIAPRRAPTPGSPPHPGKGPEFPHIQEQEMRAGGRYLSCDQPLLTFATGSETDLHIEVLWRSGRTSHISKALPNHRYTIQETDRDGPQDSVPSRPSPQPLFEPVQLPSSFVHTESTFDDFTRQPLLPWRLSRFGPAAAAFSDGDDSILILGGSRGGTLRVTRIHRSGEAQETPPPDFGPLPDDVGGLLVLPGTAGRTELFASLARFESNDSNAVAVLRASYSHGSWRTESPISGLRPSSPASMAAVDLDLDGQPELVVGGRAIPGQYPLPASVQVWRLSRGTWEIHPDFSTHLEQVGLVTGLATGDFNGDRRPDLAVACEWGAIRVYLNDGNRLQDATAKLKLDAHTGLWQSLTAADLDGDGRVDLIAGNWGLNSAHQRAPQGPWQLYYGDAAGDGQLALVESFMHPEKHAPVPVRRRDLAARSLPWLLSAFPKNADYAKATIPQILGTHASAFQAVQANTLESSVFWNLGDRFERASLPDAAQHTPVLGVASADIDGNGSLDLVLSQNFFAVRDEDDRLDAGIGLTLRNLGQRSFQAIPARECGLAVHGDGRAILALDFDRNGLPDLLMTQNAAPALLYRNTARPPVSR